MALKSTGEEELDSITVNENEAPGDKLVLRIAEAGANLDESKRKKTELSGRLKGLSGKISTLAENIQSLRNSKLANKELLKEIDDDGFDVSAAKKKKMKEEAKTNQKELNGAIVQKNNVIQEKQKVREGMALWRTKHKANKRTFEETFNIPSSSSLSPTSKNEMLMSTVFSSTNVFDLAPSTIRLLLGTPPTKGRRTDLENAFVYAACDHHKDDMNPNQLSQMLARPDGMNFEQHRSWKESSLKSTVARTCKEKDISMLDGTANHNTFSYEAAELILDKMDAREDMDDGTLDIGALATELYEEARNVGHLLNGFTQNQLYHKIRILGGAQTICMEEDCDKRSMIQGRCTQHHNACKGFEDRGPQIPSMQKAVVATVLDSGKVNPSDK